jgi:hypothetical protein
MLLEIHKKIVELTPEQVRQSDFLTTLLKDNALARIQDKMTPKKFQKFCEFLGDKLLNQLSDPNSLHDLPSLQKFVHDHIATKYPFIQDDFPAIFGKVAHKISFVRDDIMQYVVEFLSFPDNSVDMFDNLIVAFRSRTTPTIPNWATYESFIGKITDKEELCRLAGAATTLGIEPLVRLVGWQMAGILNNLSDTEVRETFKVPLQFRDSTLDAIEKLPPLKTVASWGECSLPITK